MNPDILVLPIISSPVFSSSMIFIKITSITILSYFKFLCTGFDVAQNKELKEGLKLTNLEKGIEISGRTSEDLVNNECPRDLNILPKRGCDEQCSFCWEEEFTGMYPDCWKPCECEVCQKYDETCCLNKTDNCMDCPALS